MEPLGGAPSLLVRPPSGGSPMRAPPVSLRSTLTASCFATALTGTFLSACHEYRTEEDILGVPATQVAAAVGPALDRKSTRLNSSHGYISYAVFCLKKKKINDD